MRINTIALTSCLLLASSTALAQEAAPEQSGDAPPAEEERTAKNALYLELLGPAFLYSLNYERFFSDDISARLGFSYLSISASSGADSAKASIIMVPLTASYLGIGSKTHMLELGAGGVLAYASASADFGGSESEGSAATVWGTAIVGYRYQAPDGGFLFRVGASPVIGNRFLAWPHIGLGGAF